MIHSKKLGYSDSINDAVLKGSYMLDPLSHLDTMEHKIVNSGDTILEWWNLSQDLPYSPMAYDLGYSRQDELDMYTCKDDTNDLRYYAGLISGTNEKSYIPFISYKDELLSDLLACSFLNILRDNISESSIYLQAYYSLSSIILEEDSLNVNSNAKYKTIKKRKLR